MLKSALYVNSWNGAKGSAGEAKRIYSFQARKSGWVGGSVCLFICVYARHGIKKLVLVLKIIACHFWKSRLLYDCILCHLDDNNGSLWC